VGGHGEVLPEYNPPQPTPSLTRQACNTAHLEYRLVVGVEHHQDLLDVIAIEAVLVAIAGGKRSRLLPVKAATEEPMATAVLIIRARLINMGDRQRFDRWYGAEQLPSGVRLYKAQRGWRAWSRTNPLVHIALYEFASVEEAEAILDSEALAAQIAEFDRVWGTGITRTREVVEVVEELFARN
jgi:hypothetical protein